LRSERQGLHLGWADPVRRRLSPAADADLRAAAITQRTSGTAAGLDGWLVDRLFGGR